MNNTVQISKCVSLFFQRLLNGMGKPFGINPFPRYFEYELPAPSRAHAFDEIYKNNAWGSIESRSGVGSEMVATKRYRLALASLIRQQNFQTMFDAPCGDLNWMPAVLEQVNLTYRGGDISPSLVAHVASTHPEFSVSTFDICRDDFPKADVWHCRDCLFHLPFADIRAALQRFVKSEIPYLLLTTHRARWLHRNLDLCEVGFRVIDFERAPFSFPKPLALLPDFRVGVDFPRYVALWSRTAIRAALETNEKP